MFHINQFDSKYLGVKTAHLAESTASGSIVGVLRECAIQNIRLGVWRAEDQEIPQGSWFTNLVASRSLTFVKTHSFNQNGILPKHILVSRIDSSRAREIRDDLVGLALFSGQHSRFNRDPSITRQQYRRVYEAWMDNIISNATGNFLFVATKKGTAIGFIYCQADDSCLVGHLLAISPAHRREGIGTYLVQIMDTICTNHGYKIATFKTQEDNRSALYIYYACGYQCVKRENIVHFWLYQQERIDFNIPYFSQLESRYISELINRHAIQSDGIFSGRCSKWITDKLGCVETILTQSCTAALEQAATLCDLHKGDEVIMPSYTHSSTAMAFVSAGATPVFVDIDKNCQMDTSLLEQALTPRTKAIVVVHYAGQSCDMDTLAAVCSRHSIILVEDAAQAFLAQYKGKYLGTFGQFGCLSFHYSKNTFCGEGGALLINDQRYSAGAHLVRQGGTNRHQMMSGGAKSYQWIGRGSMYLPSELNCAFLYAQLHDSEYCANRRRAIVQTYSHFLQGLQESGDTCSIININGNSSRILANGHIFWMILRPEDAEKFKTFMKENGVVCLSHFVPLHSSPMGKQCGKVASKMDLTLNAWQNLVRLPVWVAMNHTHIFQVIIFTLRYFNAPKITLLDVGSYFHQALHSLSVSQRPRL
eukprot:jgi/Picsp_1/3990/NSC_01502-R1_lipopolysaccharide biosynthesis protein rffa